MALTNTDLFIVERGGSRYKMSADQLKLFLGINQIAATIAARDLLTVSIGDEVYVVDATADATVNAGGAKYIWDGTVFIKIAEDESFDVVIDPTNLAYVAAPAQGTVTSSTGTDAIIPVVSVTNAGLATPDMFSKTHEAATTTGTSATNPIVVNAGQVLDFNIDGLLDLP